MATYQMHGDVRGTCPHQHHTLTGLARCARQDAQGCAGQGGYSDRHPYRLVGGYREPLTDEECEEFDVVYETTRS